MIRRLISLSLNYRFVTGPAYIDRGYDVAFTYRLPLGLVKGESYFRTSLLDLPVEYFTDFEPPAWKLRPLNAASIISNCVPERAALVKEISRYTQVRAAIEANGGGDPKRGLTVLFPWNIPTGGSIRRMHAHCTN